MLEGCCLLCHFVIPLLDCTGQYLLFIPFFFSVPPTVQFAFSCSSSPCSILLGWMHQHILYMYRIVHFWLLVFLLFCLTAPVDAVADHGRSLSVYVNTHGNALASNTHYNASLLPPRYLGSIWLKRKKSVLQHRLKMSPVSPLLSLLPSKKIITRQHIIYM